MDNYVGEIRLFAGSYAPVGWAICNGASISVSGNPGLFALIGTTYGGDGVNTFNLPDLRGRVPVSFGVISGGTNNYVLGQTGGAVSVTIDESTMPAHNHAMVASTAPATTTSPNGAVLAQSNGAGGTYSAVDFYNPAAANGTLDTATVVNTGGAGSHNNLMPYVVMNFIIALSGNFPMRP
ncbi:phage tail protein [Sediminibacterium ginsengisoli]|uniref:Microcystin-dependent protein n=1 Tax=Sediminibacterium ginsengisoli TaxID=413434 RepID=A0A1T4L663_9BACT|nr:tail fiber protein [Sediminibacterium ginsengisoli]SJZ50070.1 Microcystin-dependent protein [Sediminibacterium ginsengisoli]